MLIAIEHNAKEREIVWSGAVTLQPDMGVHGAMYEAELLSGIPVHIAARSQDCPVIAAINAKTIAPGMSWSIQVSNEQQQVGVPCRAVQLKIYRHTYL